ncbi:large-conductance mechanosensitive channel protein MscL [Clostridiaceae bacterium NSJ-31]|uniref:Large-conductance mechanosensitive channel n=1 Tax=Ligaoa zhengdingensis TaxID=2763658 RepID=A0A926DZ29_9FIRM|nr:large-conductance mechanosensitive channel protein MscL [Ligaoa zhengdingensis]MBC8545835.1 large-conductance mechanosensitive channel protein MscL [Ligaoa zhengdingensis]
MWQEFKKFAFKGNVIDMAVGVIIGGAFGKIVTSLVNDLIMPFFGYLTAGMDFKELKWVLSKTVMQGGQEVVLNTEILYGSFIQNIIDFLIIAFSIFLAVKLVNRGRAARKKAEEEAAVAAPPAPTEAELLTEIRDLLREEHAVTK